MADAARIKKIQSRIVDSFRDLFSRSTYREYSDDQMRSGEVTIIKLCQRILREDYPDATNPVPDAVFDEFIANWKALSDLKLKNERLLADVRSKFQQPDVEENK